MVTAELAVCLPVLVLVLGFALSVLSVGSARTRAQDAAREAARAAARGAAIEAAQRLVPEARLDVARSSADGTVVATASIDVHLVGIPAVTVTERAVAALEPTGASP